MLPVLDTIEWFFIGDIVHENKAHSSAVVSSSDGSISFLSRRVLQHQQSLVWLNSNCKTYPNLKLDTLVLSEDSLDFEVNAHRAHEGWGKRIVGITKEERCLAHAAIANDQYLEHIVKVLVHGILLPILILSGDTLSTQICLIQSKTNHQCENFELPEMKKSRHRK